MTPASRIRPATRFLFSLVSSAASPLATLGIFKVWTICLLILIPVGWAWDGLAGFSNPGSFIALLLLAIGAVFGLERTVTYSIQHGKNAQMLAGAILPALIAILIISSRRLIGLPFAVIALTASILVHYSILYMAATFFFAWYIVHFPRGRDEWKAAFQLGAAGVLSLGLFAFILPEAFSDPRAGSFGVPALGEGLARLAAVLFARHDQLLFIFNWDIGNTPEISMARFGADRLSGRLRLDRLPAAPGAG